MIPDELVEQLRTAVTRLHKTLRKQVTDHSPFSLTELETIGLVFRNQSMLPSALALQTKITTPSMSQVLKKLEEQGIIQRKPSKEDKRQIFVSLTRLGKQTVEKAQRSKDQLLKDLIGERLTKEEIRMLQQTIPILEKLYSNSVS